MAIRRSGERVVISAIEGFHSSCTKGALHGYTVSGTTRELAIFDVEINLLTKAKSLRRLTVGSGIGSGTQWVKTTRSRYLQRLKVKTPWVGCAATTTNTTKYFKSTRYPGYVTGN